MKKQSTRSLVLAIVLSFLAVGLEGQSWGDNQSQGIKESASTADNTPARQAFDNSLNTAWSLKPGSQKGWAELYWPAPRALKSINVYADLPAQTRLQFYVWQAEAWVPIAGAYLGEGAYNGTTVWFPGDLVVTSKLLVKLQGSNADQAKVWNLALTDRTRPAQYGKILPKSFSFNQAQYINIKPDRLWDGIDGNAWYEPLWSLPWEVFQTDESNKPTKIFPPYFGNPPKEAEIVWELYGTHEIQTLKAYFIQAGRSVRFEFWDGQKWTQAQSFGGLWGGGDQGWQRLQLSTPVTTNRIRITFPGGWERVRYLGELEIWGTGTNQDPTTSLVLPPLASDGSSHFTIEAAEPRRSSLEITVAGLISQPISGDWNGVAIGAPVASWVNGATVYRIPLEIGSFRAGTQFLRLKASGSLLAVVLRQEPDRGQVSLEWPYQDGFWEATQAAPGATITPVKQKSWVLGAEYSLELLRVFTSSSTTPQFKTGLTKNKNSTVWTDVSWIAQPGGWWEARLGGIRADQLQMSSSTPIVMDEVQLWGTQLTGTAKGVEVWWPQGPLTSGPSNGLSVIGWLGDSGQQAMVGGFHPRQADKLFWMPLNQMDLVPDSEGLFSVQGNWNGIVSQKDLWVQWKSAPPATLDQGAGFVSTTDATLTLTGTIKDSKSRVFLNGTEIPTIGGRYTVSATLNQGYQQLRLQVWDKAKKKLLVSWIKEVYRPIGLPVLESDIPSGDSLTQIGAVVLRGRVGNGLNLTLQINGTSVALTGNSYTYATKLNEGPQSYTFVLKDGLGRTTTKTVSLQLDTTAPLIGVAFPSPGQYFRHLPVTLTVASGGEAPLSWKINDEAWEWDAATPHVRNYTLADGFYNFSVLAQDRSGNISNPATVAFVVDLTDPKPFAITSNVSGWTNNNQPTIQFATSDDTSGIDHYEFNLDGGDWSTITSPYRLSKLEDGVHQIYVRAIDRAGNTTVATHEFQIDTSLPPTPPGVAGVPGPAEITFKWDRGTDDGEGFRTFRVERSPAWAQGVRVVEGLSTLDEGLQNGDLFSYRVWSVDRANNESPKSIWMQYMVGLTNVVLDPSQPATVESKNLSMVVPTGTLASDVVGIIINQVPVQEASLPPVNPVLGMIYKIRVSRTIDGVLTPSEHADLIKPVTVALNYQRAAIPAGYTESDLKPFYFDTIWGRWIPIGGSHIDTASQTLLFQTNHFTDFTIQATKAVDLSPQQLRDVSFSPLGTNKTHSPVRISAEGGTVSTDFTELVLPGKNGLDLVLKRTYDTGTAQVDSQAIDRNSNGEFPWLIGKGWRFNFPSLKWNADGLWLKGLDGQTLSVDQATVTGESTTNNIKTVTLVNHERSDITLKVRFDVLHKSEDNYILWVIKVGTRYWDEYRFRDASAIMKDGRQTDFDSRGRVTSISDSTGLNTITFAYSGDQASSITDSLGRVVAFEYSGDQIKKVTTHIGGENYPPINYIFDEALHLTLATDVGGREWSYEYSDEVVSSNTILKDPPRNYTNQSAISNTIAALTRVSGPGIGTTSIVYSKDSQIFQDSMTIGYKDCTYVTTIVRLIPVSLSVLEGATPLRTTTYSFSTSHKGKGQFTTDKALIDDGRTKRILTWDFVNKTRSKLSDAPEALRSSLGLGSREAISEAVTMQTDATLQTSSGIQLETQTVRWDRDNIRVKELTTTRAPTNKNVVEYTYDNWGNVTNQKETKTVGTNVVSREIVSDFWNTTTEAPDLTRGQRSLIKSRTTIVSDGLDAKERYEYTPLGQLKNAYRWSSDDNLWAQTSYEYDAVTGQVHRVLGPTGAETLYDYDYSPVDRYVITTTLKDVALAENVTKSLVTSNEYLRLTGTLTKTTDALQNTTSRLYDWLDRVTDIYEPAVNGKVPHTHVAYEDKPLSSTVTNRLGGTETYLFDSLGRLTRVTKSNSVPQNETITTELTYDGFDQVTAVKGPLSSLELPETGRTLDSLKTVFEYDARGRVTVIRSPGSIRAKTSSYDDALNVVETTDEMGVHTKQTIDWNGQILSQSLYDGTKWLTSETRYDGAGRVIAQTAPNGAVTTTTYNSLGLKASIEAPARLVGEEMVQPTTTMKYFLDGSLKSQSSSAKTSFQVNSLGQVLRSDTPVTVDGKPQTLVVLSGYDELGHKISESSGYLGQSFKHQSWTYDAQGRLLSQTNGNDQTTSYQYDVAGNRTLVEDPRKAQFPGFFLELKYDQLNRLSIAQLPSIDSTHPEIRFTYDGRGNLTERKDADGQITSYTYTLRNQMNTESVGNLKTSILYDDAGRQTTVIQPSGQSSYTEYDLAGRIHRQGNNTAGWTVRSYDENGNVKTVTDGRGNLTTTNYTVDNLPSEIIDAKGVVTYHRYDLWGRLKTTLNGGNNERVYSYDEIGRLINEKTPWGTNIRRVNDAWNNISEMTDGMETVFSRQYYDDNRLRSETATKGSQQVKTEYVYDEAGDLRSVTQNGLATTYNLKDGKYQPDPFGLTRYRSQMVEGQSLAMEYSYDTRQRLTDVQYPDASHVSYQYNKLNQLTTVSDWITGELQYGLTNGLLESYEQANTVKKVLSYDSQNRIETMEYQLGEDVLKSYRFGYDQAGNIVTKNQNNYNYDKLNRLIRADETGWFQKQPEDLNPRYGIADRDYTGSAVVDFKILPSETVILDTKARSLSVDLGLDRGINRVELVPQNNANRIRARDLQFYYRDPQGTYLPMPEWTMTKEATGKLVIVFKQIIQTRFLKVTTSWDDRLEDNSSTDDNATFQNLAGQLLRVWTLTTNRRQVDDFDATGNRRPQTLDNVPVAPYLYYKNDNQGDLPWLASSGDWYYEYDLNGNLVTKAKKATIDLQARTFILDPSQEYWRYTWDPLNRLTEVQKNGTSVVNYRYDSDNLRVSRTKAGETTVYAYGRQGAIAYTKNLATKATRTYAYLNNQILGWTDTTGAGTSTRYWATTDQLGSVTQITDDAAQVVWNSEYTPYGLTAGTEGLYPFDGSYAGHQPDSDTGLIYMWNRWQDPETGRFISEDPAKDGENWYAYVGNNPINRLDPTGLDDTQASGDFWAGLKSDWDNFWSGGWNSNQFGLRSIDEYIDPVTNIPDYNALSIDLAQASYNDTVNSLGPGLGDFGRGFFLGDDDTSNAKLGAAFGLAATFMFPEVSPGKAALQKAFKLGADVDKAGLLLASGRDGIGSWNEFQKLTAGAFSTRQEAAQAWDAYKTANQSSDVLVIGTRADTLSAADWSEHAILNRLPPKEWSLKINASWVGGGIDRGATFYLGSPVTMSTMWDSVNNRATVFARELRQLTDAGYVYRDGYMVAPR